MNSAGRVTATSTVMRMMPSSMSLAVMVSPKPTWISYASSGVEPASPPRFHTLRRKLSIIERTFIQVAATFGSKTYALAAFFTDSSRNIIVRRTFT